MSLLFWRQVSKALARLNPDRVIEESEAPFSLALVGSNQEVSDMEDWLVPPHLSPQQQARGRRLLFTMRPPLTPGDRTLLERVDGRLVGESAAHPASNEVSRITTEYIYFHRHETPRVSAHLLAAMPDHTLALARHFPALRAPVTQGIVSKTAKENAAFALLSAIPNVIPSPIELPWAIGEFASDTVVITANQMRMALAVAAAFDSPVGFLEQRGQVLSILGSAFGLRAIARELAGKVPAGGGLVVKGLIAYAGTYTLGQGLVHWHRSGRRLTRSEKRRLYTQAMESGRAKIEDMARRALGRAESRQPVNS
jgi:uncharacterized protein (DUF697 family)